MNFRSPLLSIWHQASALPVLLVFTLATSGCPSSNSSTHPSGNQPSQEVATCGVATRSAYNSQELIVNLQDLFTLSQQMRAPEPLSFRPLTPPGNGDAGLQADTTDPAEIGTSQPHPQREVSETPDGGSNHSARSDAGTPDVPIILPPDDLNTLTQLSVNWICLATSTQFNTVLRFMSADYITQQSHRLIIEQILQTLRVRMAPALQAQARRHNPVVTTMDAVADVFMIAFILDMQRGALRGLRNAQELVSASQALSTRTRSALTRAERYGIVVDEMFRATRGRLSRHRMRSNFWILGLGGSLSALSTLSSADDYLDPDLVLDLARAQSVRLLGRRAAGLRTRLERTRIPESSSSTTRDELTDLLTQATEEADELTIEARRMAVLVPALRADLLIVQEDLERSLRAIRRIRNELGDLRHSPELDTPTGRGVPLP